MKTIKKTKEKQKKTYNRHHPITETKKGFTTYYSQLSISRTVKRPTNLFETSRVRLTE